VALDQPFFLNRLGALEATGMMFALKRDVVPISGTTLTAGNVQLRSDKRPRPLVLRMNVGDCLTITFTNLLAKPRKDADQVNTRNASIHVIGMELTTSIADDGSNVGKNNTPFVAPGGTAIYHLFAQHEGGYVMYSTDTIGGEGDGGQQSAGLLGAINVEPPGARWYRSQVTQNEMQLATTGLSADGVHPNIDYDAKYLSGPLLGQPILNMLFNNEIIKSDLTALITGPLAVINGKSTPGRFAAGTFFKNPQLPDREQPFREFTIIYHDEIGAVQAFPEFFDPLNNPPPPGEGAIAKGIGFTLHSAVDGFAINYGTGGIGSEVIANRLGVGPQWNCTECKYEEAFLSSWAVGEPAMVVDIPANTRDALGNVIKGPKATKALYPDDPSNVYHSYIGDHTKFRILHGGVKEHHIHHQHAHQWVHSPNSDDSSYDDSEAIGPGAAFTLEMTYNGGGNRNKTVGDSIFHCHFYPHFAQGMWSLWRTHDVFEAGTQLDANGRPAVGSRALPDGEIKVGTPIPALVPIPTIAMAPMPGPASVNNATGQVVLPNPVTVNPGYPFFVAAVAGHRPPKPPWFTEFDGGLPRHIITGGTFNEAHTRLDFHKTLITANATQVAEKGSPAELVAIAYHAVRNHPSVTPEGLASPFVTNGLPAQMGAPYADPCVDDNGLATGVPRTYQSADIELPVTYNKAGWFYKQHRMSALWQDVAPTRNHTRPPQPLFFRANSNDCITFKVTNLMPNEMQQDDFQVRTPTDVVGQHIHLVKFDVTASDGAGNGWNYEEGVFSPGEVIERINAINKLGGSWTPLPGQPTTVAVKQHPFFTGPDGLGAQTVVERWYADRTINNVPAPNTQDRTLRTVFTHDHFGPSSHQQAGLYAGLLIEPEKSTWKDSESGLAFGTRTDGGPTGWETIISDTVHPNLSFREFMMEFQDYQLAYTASNIPINPPARDEVPIDITKPDGTVLLLPAAFCPQTNNTITPPCPEALSSADVGTFTVNYRNEPIPLRILQPGTTSQAAGAAGDLAQVYRSNVTRADPAFNVQPATYPPLTNDLRGGDPYTPLFRTYQDDALQVRMLVGAHEEGHNFHVHGTRWLREASDARSGWRGSQMAGISEHMEFDLPPLSNYVKVNGVADFLYEPGASEDDQWNGLWGLIRAYNGLRADLQVVPNNTNGGKQNTVINIEDFNTTTDTTSSFSVASTTSLSLDSGTATTDTALDVPTDQAVDETLSGTTITCLNCLATTTTTTDLATTTLTADVSVVGIDSLTGSTITTNSVPAPGSAYSVCPRGAPRRTFDVTAIGASDLPAGAIVYNSRTPTLKGELGTTEAGPLTDPTAIIYVRTADLDSTTHKLKAGVAVEPLVLRAAAGDCINLTLRNHLPNVVADLPGYNTLPMIVNKFNSNQVAVPNLVGLHPELLSVNVLNSDGFNVGLNPVQTVSPGHKRSYQWYAGIAWINPNTNAIVHTPVEFGSVALMPADLIKQASKGAIGALIIEPQGSSWTVDLGTRASANVTKADGITKFREFVLLLQNDVNMRYASGHPVKILAHEEDPEDTGAAGFNYRTEPHWFRKGYAAEAPFTPVNGVCDPLCTKDVDFSNVLNNTFTNFFTGVATTAEPQTPILTATPGQAIRLHLVQPVGHPRNNIFQLHGHVWEEEPYTTPVAFTGATYSGRTVLGTPVLGSTIIADQPTSTNDFVNNRFSEWEGSQMGVGPSSHFDIIPSGGAGGPFHVTGDFLYRTHNSGQFDKGVWGILRVQPPPPVQPAPDPTLLQLTP
jgi:hypothetical protein